MRQRQILKPLLLLTWTLAAAALTWAITNQDRFYALQIRPIATLTEKIGTTVARSEGLVRWHDLASGQGVFDGDVVATGLDSTGRVRFDSKRSLTVGEDSQVKITAITTAEHQYAFMITLIRGTVAAQVDKQCGDCPPLIFRAGEETMTVPAGKTVGLFKAQGSREVKHFQPTLTNGPLAYVKARSDAVLSANFLHKEPATPVAVPPPPPEPAPPPPPRPREVAVVAKVTPPRAPQAEGLAIEPQAPTSGLTLWSMLPLDQLKSQTIEIPFTAPTRQPDVGAWRAVLALKGVGDSGQPELLSQLNASGNAVMLPLGKALAKATVSSKGAIKEYTFTVTGGAEVSAGAAKARSFSTQPLTFTVYSLGELPSAPLSLGLDSFGASSSEDSSSPWTGPKELVPVASAPLRAHLFTADDKAAFLPSIRAAKQLGISRAPMPTTSGIYVVRHQEIVAQLEGSGLDKMQLTKALALLKGDFIFKGNKSSLHDGRSTSQTAMVDLVKALLDKGQVLYILKRSKIYPVSRDFIKTNAEVASFIDSQAKAVFLDKVEILADR